ncbi:hypothetical protein ACVWY2_008469 [Bradyrhizobium sp. JR6.1]
MMIILRACWRLHKLHSAGTKVAVLERVHRCDLRSSINGGVFCAGPVEPCSHEEDRCREGPPRRGAERSTNFRDKSQGAAALPMSCIEPPPKCMIWAMHVGSKIAASLPAKLSRLRHTGRFATPRCGIRSCRPQFRDESRPPFRFEVASQSETMSAMIAGCVDQMTRLLRLLIRCAPFGFAKGPLDADGEACDAPRALSDQDEGGQAANPQVCAAGRSGAPDGAATIRRFEAPGARTGRRRTMSRTQFWKRGCSPGPAPAASTEAAASPSPTGQPWTASSSAST